MPTNDSTDFPIPASGTGPSINVQKIFKQLSYPTYPSTGAVINIGNKPNEYKTQIKSRVSVPVGGTGPGLATLEMTVAQEGEYVEFTMLLPGRQAIHFVVHRKDLEALAGELTLDKLSK